MKFCDSCGTKMTTVTTDTNVVHICICGNKVNGSENDTLLYEKLYEISESNQKHEIFIENSPFDPARNIVMKTCPICKIDFMTMIMLGGNMTSIFTCTCGYRTTLSEYIHNGLNITANSDKK